MTTVTIVVILQSPLNDIFLIAASINDPDIWNVLLEKSLMFVRDQDGESGLDSIINLLPVSESNKILKSYLKTISTGE